MRHTEMAKELKPRLCVMAKDDGGYGFHLHGEKGKSGQFIRKVEPGSSAEAAGLRAGDRVVEVNGENVERDTHHQVVQRIKGVQTETRLLVVDAETDAYLRSLRLTCTEEMATAPPAATPAAAPARKQNGSLSKTVSLDPKHGKRPPSGNGKQRAPAAAEGQYGGSAPEDLGSGPSWRLWRHAAFPAVSVESVRWRFRDRDFPLRLTLLAPARHGQYPFRRRAVSAVYPENRDVKARVLRGEVLLPGGLCKHRSGHVTRRRSRPHQEAGVCGFFRALTCEPAAIS
ncbi:hypothetical protein COCON_G00023020 [Conger conger]|uniref:PDZ domain-containing protein n=1 Tax=Conger conger TaxID=82655 RepID=A0A9Q1I4M2_CONCO|nr:hypothetical protein COCON_G00023020 [Conger conger]